MTTGSIPEDEVFSPDRPSPARMYDYFLHGTDNFPVDREAADRVIERLGVTLTRSVVWENRHFLGRVVRHLAAEHGIRQFIDVGAGLPSVDNTHQAAHAVAPEARVLYVDNDPVVAAHGERLLKGAGDRARTLTADLREPESILESPVTRDLIDLSQPVALLFVAVFHFIKPEEDPRGLMARYREGLAPGSFAALTHLCTDDSPDDERRLMMETYKNSPAPMVYRTSEEIGSLMDGFELLEPGLVPPGLWRPEPGREESTRRFLSAVGRVS
ncbi:SAM-dependent methyltransferase [Nocardiopsis sp. NPDC049922]|uniref:SAM-dependent methyltransferase n=1 Tax=Nocardiopsis sp. NPDC049922 TaxID=3155157 RepID=UPI0033ECF426